jgi:hypothetical protein
MNAPSGMSLFTAMLCQLALAGMMAGLVWFVQVVHYPLMAEVGERFVSYELLHTQRTGWIVAPLMLAELAVTAYCLIFAWQTESRFWILAAATCLAGCWLVTFFVSVPLHGKLSVAFNAADLQRLISSNWIRTWLWTARVGFLIYALAKTKSQS